MTSATVVTGTQSGTTLFLTDFTYSLQKKVFLLNFELFHKNSLNSMICERETLFYTLISIIVIKTKLFVDCFSSFIDQTSQAC